MRKLKGKSISDEILADLREKISKEKVAPGLAVVLVGNDESSKIYVNLKGKRASEIGINFSLKKFPDSCGQEEIISEIKRLNKDNSVDGIIVQLPLPEKFETLEIIESIDPRKDVDGFSFGKQFELEPVFLRAIMKVIKSTGNEFGGKVALAIVNSKNFGEIMKKEFEAEGMKGSFILSENIKAEKENIGKYDIVVSAIGSAGVLKGEYFKDGAIVIDGGISKVGEKVLGDVDAESLKNLDVILSPVPGGVGPVTIACLLENVYLSYKNNLKK